MNAPLDMSQVIVPRSDQINSDDLISGPRTIRITEVDIRPGTEQPVSIFYDGDNGKPWRPCKSMSRVLVAAWGPDASRYVGRSVTLYRDPNVKWGGMDVGGIRVSHLSDIERDMVMALTATKGKRAPYTVKVLQNAPSVEPAFTIDQARSDIEFAADLDALKAVWTRKIMAPFRAELQADLDARKAALAEPETGRTDDGTASTAAADLIARIEAAAVIADVMKLEADYQQTRTMFEVAEQDQIETAIEARRAALKGGK